MLCRSRQQKAIRALAAGQPTDQPTLNVTPETAGCVPPTVDTDTDLNTCSSAGEVKHLEEIFSGLLKSVSDSPSGPHVKKAAKENLAEKPLNSDPKSSSYKADVPFLLSDEILSRTFNAPAVLKTEDTCSKRRDQDAQADQSKQHSNIKTIDQEEETHRKEPDNVSSSENTFVAFPATISSITQTVTVSESVKSPGDALWKFTSHPPRCHGLRRSLSLPVLSLTYNLMPSIAGKEEVSILLNDFWSQSQVTEEVFEQPCFSTQAIQCALGSQSASINGPSVVQLFQKVKDSYAQPVVQEADIIKAACDSYRLESQETSPLSSMRALQTMAQTIIPWNTLSKEEEFHTMAFEPLPKSANVVTREPLLFASKQNHVIKRRSATHSEGSKIYVTLSLENTFRGHRKDGSNEFSGQHVPHMSKKMGSDWQSEITGPPAAIENALQMLGSRPHVRRPSNQGDTIPPTIVGAVQRHSDVGDPAATFKKTQASGFVDAKATILLESSSSSRRSRRDDDNERLRQSTTTAKKEELGFLGNFTKTSGFAKENTELDLKKPSPRKKNNMATSKHNLRNIQPYRSTDYLRSTINARAAIKPKDSTQQTKEILVEKPEKAPNIGPDSAAVRLSEDEPSYVLDLLSCSSEPDMTMEYDSELPDQAPLSCSNQYSSSIRDNAMRLALMNAPHSDIINRRFLNSLNRAGCQTRGSIIPPGRARLRSPYRGKSVTSPVGRTFLTAAGTLTNPDESPASVLQKVTRKNSFQDS